MAFRVEIFRDETLGAGGVTVEIIAYIEREPETPAPGLDRLVRIYNSVWNTRLLYSGDFEELSDALAATEAAYPDIDRIACWEWTVDDEFKREAAPLLRSGAKWRPGEPPQYR